MKFAFLEEPPFNFRDAEGEVTGCDVAVARHVATELDDGPFTPIETEFAALLPGLNQGRWQMTTGLIITQERARRACFSRPIWLLPDGLLIGADNPLSIAGYRSLAAHREGRLAVVRHQLQHQRALAFGVPDHRISVFETYQDAATAVREGRAAAFASVERAHTGFLAQHPDWDLRHLAIPVEELKPAAGAFAFAPQDENRRLAADRVLDRYIGSPAHIEMMRGFGFTDAELDLLCQGPR
ncbi:MAG: transporter substrate-binding domain-containing protein [Pseudomonadota bacterium]